MSIYTITLKRERTANWFEDSENSEAAAAAAAAALERQQERLHGDSSGESGSVAHGYNRQQRARPATDDFGGLEAKLNEADWLGCVCGQTQLRDITNSSSNKQQQSQQAQQQQQQHNQVKVHSNECLEARRTQLSLLDEKASRIKHSVNVTLEVSADLSEHANRIVWYKNNQQLTSTEQPVLFARKRKRGAPLARSIASCAQAGKQQQITTTTTTTTTKTKTTNATGGGQERLLNESSEKVQEVRVLQDEQEQEQEQEEQLVPKCVQESGAHGSKLTICDLQDEDYGQYTCKLIDLIDGRQLDIHTHLKEEEEAAAASEATRQQQQQQQLNYLRSYKFGTKMDEVIEVKEGDLNIELGIQILPETNDDEELMSEEEKADFIANTTITWFKDDVKLSEEDEDVRRLFEFTYDKNEGFHRLIVRKASKETEGVYTCQVENESGTSSCCTQLVVGPGNKPKLTSGLHDVTVYVGQTIEFRVKSTGLPPIDTCRWYKDDELLIESSSRHTSRTVSGRNSRVSMTRTEEDGAGDDGERLIIFSLQIESLALDDTGRYKCRIINEHGYDETESFVKVLQEIIEEHEQVEEMIEETSHVADARSKRREQEEECETSTQVVEERTTKRQKQQDQARPRFLRELRDTEAYMGETVVLSVALDEHDEWARADEVRFTRDGRLMYSSRMADSSSDATGRQRLENASSKSRVYIRSYEQVIEVEEETTTTTTTTRRRSSSSAGSQKRRARIYELTIENTQVDQAGTWACEAQNSAGMASCAGDLEVFAEPRIVTDLDERKRVDEHNEIRLVVEASGSPQPVYSWFKDGIGIAEEEDRVFTQSKKRATTTTTTTTTTSEERRRSSVTSSLRTEDGVSISGETLIIKGARPEDAGDYTCKVENRLGQVSSRVCKVIIAGHGDDLNSAPKIIKDFSAGQIVRVDEGESVTLKVLADGHPKPRQTWLKDSREVEETSTTRTSVEERRSSLRRISIDTDGQEYALKITRSHAQDSGKYKVVLRNEFGETESRTVEVQVQKPAKDGERRPSAPKILSDSQDKCVGVGSTVSFDVQVGGHPKPFISWYKNGRRMTESLDGRVSFVEEEEVITTTTTTTTTTSRRNSMRDAEDETQHKETITVHRLIIRDVRDADEAIYSLKAENDLGSCKSSLTSLTIDKRREAVDEVAEREAQKAARASKAVSEETVETVTETVTTERLDGQDASSASKRRRSSALSQQVADDAEDDETATKTRRTRTKTTTTTTTTTEEEEDEDARRRRATDRSEADTTTTSRKSSLAASTGGKRRTLVEEEEEEEEEEEVIEDVEDARSRSQRKRRSRADVTQDERQDEVAMEVDDEVTTTTTTSDETRRTSAKRRGSRALIEERSETTQIERETTGAPRLLSAPKHVVAGLGSSPELEVEVTKTETTEEKVTWLKNGEEIPARLLRDNHIEIIEKSESIDGTTKHILRINSLRSSDAGNYKLRVDTPKGAVETDDIKVELDRSMRSNERPQVTPADIAPAADDGAGAPADTTTGARPSSGPTSAPELLSAPKEVVAGLGSTPEVEVAVQSGDSSRDNARATWLKNGDEIPARLLRDNHIEIIEKSESTGVTKHILRINSLRASDVGDYKLRVDNPLGSTETDDIAVQLDRSMRSDDKPQVTPAEVAAAEPRAASPTDSAKATADELADRTIDEATRGAQGDRAAAPTDAAGKPLEGFAPQVVKAAQEVVAGVGSQPVLEVVVRAKPQSEVTWHRDGMPIAPDELRNKYNVAEQPVAGAPEDTRSYTLQVKDLKPVDVAAYHVKAENPYGEVESEPINVRIDRSMDKYDEPQVATTETPFDEDEARESATRPASVERDLPTAARSKPTDDDESSKPTGAEAPRVLSAPKQVAAGLGSSPEIDVAVAAPTGDDKPTATWLKNGEEIPARLLRDNHIELLEKSQPNGVTKHTLRINSLRSSDAGDYKLRLETPQGAVAETDDIAVKVDRSMRDSQQPDVTPADIAAPSSSAPSEDARPASAMSDDQSAAAPGAKSKAGYAPQVVKATEEVVAGVGSQPQLEVVVRASPQCDVSWHRDGMPIQASELRRKYSAAEEPVPGDADARRYTLNIADLKPVDAAAYHLKAENIHGDVESEPINVRIDRAMSKYDEPKVSEAAPMDVDTAAPSQQGPTSAPQLLSAPREIVAGLGSSPEIEAVVAGGASDTQDQAKATWLKNGEEIPARLLRDNHIELVEKSTPTGATKHILRINSLRATDAGDYKLRVENPLGAAETDDIAVQLDRSMRSSDEPQVTPADVASQDQAKPSAQDEGPMDVDETPSRSGDAPEQAGRPQTASAPVLDSQTGKPLEGFAPQVVKAAQEVVAGVGSQPVLEVVVRAKPQSEVTWHRDGMPIAPEELRNKYNVAEQPVAGAPEDTHSYTLQVKDLKPVDVAAYHVKAENPYGEVESEPINVRIDRSMDKYDEPQVAATETPFDEDEARESAKAPAAADRASPARDSTEAKPEIVSAPQEVRIAPGSSGVVAVDVKASPDAQVTWLKDGKPIPARLLRNGHVEIAEQSSPLDANAKRHTLKINDAAADDAAAYSVQATNDLGSTDSAPIRVVIDEAPDVLRDTDRNEAPEIVKAPKEITIAPGDSGVLAVDVKASPDTDIGWYKDDAPISPRQLRDGHLAVGEEESPDDASAKRHTLAINDATPADAGKYHLEAKNDAGKAESAPIDVAVESGDAQAPQIVSAPQQVNIAPGSTGTLAVDIKASPAAQVTWLKDGKPIPARLVRDGHLQTTEASSPLDANTKTYTLKICDALPSDTAAYTARATNDLGDAESAPIQVQVQDKPASDKAAPEIVSAPQQVTIAPGSSGQVAVDVKASPDAQVKWFKDDAPISPRQLRDGHFAVAEQASPDDADAKRHTLTINDATPADTGAYHAQATNDLGKAESAPTHVNVDRTAADVSGDRRAPEIVSAPQQVRIAPDSTGVVAVDVSASPAPQISWYKNGKPIPADLVREGHLVVAEQASPVDANAKRYTLTIKNATPEDAAAYHLRAANDLGEAASAPTQVAVDGATASGDKMAPEIVSAPQQVTIAPGASGTVAVDVKAVPDAQAQWFKDDAPISPRQLRDGHFAVAEDASPDDADAKRHTLTINDATPTDAGAYHLQATNELGKAESAPAQVSVDKAATDSRIAPEIVGAPQQVEATPGSTAVVAVDVKAAPAPQIAWYKDGKPVPATLLRDGHLAVAEQSSPLDANTKTYVLTIKNAGDDDVAAYHVQATNELGRAESAPTQVVLTSGDDGPAKAGRRMAPKIVSAPRQVVAAPGSDAVVAVDVKSSPNAQVKWFKDGKPVRSDSRVCIAEQQLDGDTKRHILSVGKVHDGDAAAYHLEATNELGSAESAPTQLLVSDDSGVGAGPKRAPMRAPTIKRVPRTVCVKEGKRAVIEIEVAGEPKPEVVWYRNGVRIEASDAHYKREESPESGTHRLVIEEAQTSDEAEYSVVATNEAGACESSPVLLQVEAERRASRADESAAGAPVSSSRRPSSTTCGYAPQIVRATEEVVAGAGSQPQLEVVVRAAPRCDICWFRDGQPIAADELRTKYMLSEHQVPGEPDTRRYALTFADLKPVDVGAYHVKAENAYGDIESAPINVRIGREMDAQDEPQVSATETPFDETEARESAKQKRPLRAPTIKRLPRKIVAPFGSNPVIEIVVEGEPKPEVIWYKNGRRVSEKSAHVTIERAAGGIHRLCFENVKLTDQAEYTVRAINEAGEVESAPIELKVDRNLARSDAPLVLMDSDGPAEAPRIVRLEDAKAVPGQTVKLEAEIVGNPRPQIKWLKDGDEVELNINEVPNSNVHSLTLKNVNELYDGVYSIEAKNIAGVARKDARVSIVDKLDDAPAQTVRAAPEPVVVKRKEPEERQEKPFIKRGLKFSQVNQGRSIKFEVLVDGPYDEVIWMKDGERLNAPSATGGDDDDEVSDDAATLRGESDIEDDDEVDAASGKRRCGPRIVARPRNIVAGPGSRVAFEVRVEGEPRPQVSWFKDMQRVTTTQDGKIIIEETSDGCVRLIIENVDASDVAEYHVIAENELGSERTIPVTLELDEHMCATDDLANCGGGDELAADLAEPVDARAGTPLKRGRAPRILSRPRAVHAPKGSRVAFEVQVSGEPEPIVNWFRDGRLVHVTPDGHVSIEEHSNGCYRLVLDNIQDADVGQYHVVTENALGSERSIPVTLTIDEEDSSHEASDLAGDFVPPTSVSEREARARGRRPPRIVLRPRNVQATQGSEFVLEVFVAGQSRPSIVWHKNGSRMQVREGTDERVRVEKISDSYERLVVSDCRASDAGAYSVSAENDFGVAMSEPVKVEVTTTTTTQTTTTTTTTSTFFEKYVDDGSKDAPGARKAPRFTVRPRNRRAPLGSNVEFEVRVSGEPKPDVVWYKNGRRVHQAADGRVRVEEFSDGGSRLVIENALDTDAGVYACEARNELGSARTRDVQLRVTERSERSQRVDVSQRASDGARVTTKTTKTRTHYTFEEERRSGYVTMTLTDAQLEHDGDYKLVVRNKWGEASTQAPLVVIPKVEPRSTLSMDRSLASGYDDSTTPSSSGRESRARRTPFDELEDYGHELDKSVGVFGSESRYQSGEDTYLLQLRDTEFPLRLRKYLRFGARQSASLRSNLMDTHWGAGARVTIRERRKFREVMDEEIDDERRGLDASPTPMRLQKEVGTCGYAAAQLEHLRVEAAERLERAKSAGTVDGDASSGRATPAAGALDMMPPFLREKLKDAVVEETSASRQQVAVFACLAAGQPAPEYTWFKNDIIITDLVGRMDIVQRASDGGSELRIKTPCLTDAGCYKCVARNVHGNVTTRARLRVATRPSRPEPPEYVSVTSRQVFLQWRKPRDYEVNAAEVLGYRLEMSQSSIGDSDECWRVLAADIGHEYYIVDDLTPSTSYSFRLSARNKFGWSESSYSAYVTTDKPEAASDEAAQHRLQVPHEMRARQYTSDVCDPRRLRTCEEPKRPRMNYSIELDPVKVNGQSGEEKFAHVYALQAEIARGRFSCIAKATRRQPQPQQDDNDDDAQYDDCDNPNQVVVKLVPSSCAIEAQTKNEFDILRSLQHEKVVRLLMAYRDEHMFAFVMERLSGIDVLTYLSSFTSYNEDTVSRIITQVMDAIEYLHFRGMCLLELLPDNVVMTNGRSTALKLVDFSSARFVPRAGCRVPANMSQNIEYCPPEVIANHEVSTASDVWCIGVLTYVLLSGRSPFRGESHDETRENVRLGRYKYDHMYANCTPEVTRFLINVFKKHSSKRPTIEQLYENKWLLPNESMIRKRQHATFKTDKIVAFAEEFHKLRQQDAQQHAQAVQAIVERLGGGGSADE